MSARPRWHVTRWLHQNQNSTLVQLRYIYTVRRKVLVISALLSILSPLGSVGASAHGGGLDSDGGHNCYVPSCAGTYHCHRYRGGRCPLAGFGTSAPVSPTVSALATELPPPKKYKNCSELRRVYPKGVARNARSAKASGAIVDAKTYRLNIRSDRDRDGIACE